MLTLIVNCVPPHCQSSRPLNTTRKIIHIDMDAFFASVEQRDKPELRGRPVIVGGLPDRRGVVAAASYEVREFGVHSAMSSARAMRLCPEAVFVRPRFEAYRRESEFIRAIFRRYTALVEPLSLDEAYLDVSDCEQCQGSATLIARDIKRRIFAETGLRASAGVSYNKFLAKIASDMDKPDGLYLIPPEQGPGFIAKLPVHKFHGVGKATARKMQALGIHTGRDLRQWSLDDLLTRFGKVGRFYYLIVRGIDERPVRPERVRKSVGCEKTFLEDLHGVAACLRELRPLADRLETLLREKALAARTLTLKVKYHDFVQITRSQTLEDGYTRAQEIGVLLPGLLARTGVAERAVRLLGLTASGLQACVDEDPISQLPLFAQ